MSDSGTVSTTPSTAVYSPDIIHQKNGQPKLHQRRRSSLQYCYQYTRRHSLPRHTMFMYPIDTDLAEPPPLLRSASSSTQFSPLTPGSGPINTLTANLDSPSSPTSSATSPILSIAPIQSHLRRTMLLPKSPTSPTFWKRLSHYHYATPTSPSIKTHLRVLLVDDNEVNLQVLTKALKVHMTDVFQQIDMVSSGEDAIDKLRQQSYDLILMDIDMPGLSGIDTTTWIRHGHQQEQHHHLENHQLETVLAQNRCTPIVAVTTNMSLEWKKAYLKVGMNGCISKPISPYVLRHSLAQVLMYGSYWDYSES